MPNLNVCVNIVVGYHDDTAAAAELLCLLAVRCRGLF